MKRTQFPDQRLCSRYLSLGLSTDTLSGKGPEYQLWAAACFSLWESVSLQDLSDFCRDQID